MVFLWPSSVTMGLPSTVKISRPSARNEIFTMSHQALIMLKVMVMLKMQVRLVSHCWPKPKLISMILEWCNTPTEGMNASPVQLLYGRRTRTRHPVAKQLLTPQVISDVPEKIKIRKQKQKHYYDRHSHELPKLLDGDAIRMRLPGKKEWSLGHIIGEEGTVPTWLRCTESIIVGTANGSGQPPRSYQSQWRQTATWPVLLNWLKQAQLSRHTANDTIITSGFWAAHWRSSSAGPPPPVWLKDYKCWNKTLALPCASFFYFGFTMYSCTGVFNVQDFLRQIWTLSYFFLFLLSSTFCLHLL